MEVTLQSFKNRFTYDPQKDLLGKGGYSEVYKAFDNEDQIYVALKIYQGDADSKYNLSNEIRKFKRLRHANVIEHIEAYEVVTGNQDIHGNPIKYQVGILEYANAGTLADLIKSGKLIGKENEVQLESIAKDIIAGLEYLHSKNIIHRDLKPSNILLFKDGDKITPKICDFGIAKIMDNATAVSTQLVGTIEYMAPEYFRTDIGEIGKESDLWSLGVILLEASTGKHPFGKANEGYTNGQIINNILSKELHIELIVQQSTRFVIDYIRKALRIKDIEQTIEEVSEPLTITKKNEEVQKEATKKAKSIDESEKTAIGDSEEEAIDESKEEVIGESKEESIGESEKKAVAETEKTATIEKAKNDLLIALKLKEEQTRKKRQRLMFWLAIPAFLIILIAYGIMQYYKGENEVENKKEKLISIDTPTPILVQKVTPIDSFAPKVNEFENGTQNADTVVNNKVNDLSPNQRTNIPTLSTLISSEKPKKEYPNSDSSTIIGKPIRIGSIEVAQFNFPECMIWNDAVKACTDLGNGWRLPTKYELNLMYLNKDKIGGFVEYDYWSSTEFGDYSVWVDNFRLGSQFTVDKNQFKYYVRAVRAF